MWLVLQQKRRLAHRDKGCCLLRARRGVGRKGKLEPCMAWERESGGHTRLDVVITLMKGWVISLGFAAGPELGERCRPAKLLLGLRGEAPGKTLGVTRFAKAKQPAWR